MDGATAIYNLAKWHIEMKGENIKFEEVYILQPKNVTYRYILQQLALRYSLALVYSIFPGWSAQKSSIMHGTVPKRPMSHQIELFQ